MNDRSDTTSPPRSLAAGLAQRLASFHHRSLRVVVVAGIVAAGIGLSWFEPRTILLLRELVWDEMVRAKPRPYDPDLKVRIVDIDEASLASHGQWPWPRARMARLIDALADYGARAVAFDVIFAEPDRTSLRQVFGALQKDVPGFTSPLAEPLLAEQPDNDAILAASMSRLPVILGLSVEQEVSAGGARQLEKTFPVKFERRKDQRNLLRYPGAISALPELQKQAAANAFIDVVEDPDGITRWMPLVARVIDRTVPSLAFALLREVYPQEQVIAASRGRGLRSISVGPLHVPTDPWGRARLYDSGERKERYIPAADVLSGKADKSGLDGALVFVGTSAEGLHDLRLTPLDKWVPGVQTHAQIVEQMLSGVFLIEPDWRQMAEIAAMAVFGLLLMGAAWFGWSWMPSWVVAVAASAGIAAFAWIAFSRFGLLVDPLTPAVALLSAAALDRFLLVLDLRRERSVVRGAFSRYLAPAVVEQLAEDPDRLTLGGERREMTFLFGDIREFTAISEQFEKDPEGLTRLINRFLTPMTDDILERHGTIDKFMGDCIMAFWNAPLDDPYHAAHACESALAMQESLFGLNEQLSDLTHAAGRSITLKVGIGINTGNGFVGNMGSEQRFDYSVLGDAVNLASRLEGQSKTYGVDILIGETTRAAAPEFASLEADLIAVKGRAAAERVYVLLGDSVLRDTPAFGRLEAAQEAMLAAYRGRDWETALEHLFECRETALPEWHLDALFDLYEWRIHDFEMTAPPPDWAGVYEAMTK